MFLLDYPLRNKPFLPFGLSQDASNKSSRPETLQNLAESTQPLKPDALKNALATYRRSDALDTFQRLNLLNRETAKNLNLIYQNANIYRQIPEDVRDYIETVGAYTHQSRNQLNLMADLVNKDPFYGLYTKDYFLKTLDDRYNDALAQHKSLSVGVFDLDLFADFNDRAGFGNHVVGDIVLKLLGQTVNDVVESQINKLVGQEKNGKTQPAGIVAKYGGEELAVWLYGLTPQQAKGVYENIIEAVPALQNLVLSRKKIDARLDEKSLEDMRKMLATRPMTVSGGYVFLPPLGNNSANSGHSELINHSGDLFTWADKALKQAKEAGRNRLYEAVIDPSSKPQDKLAYQEIHQGPTVNQGLYDEDTLLKANAFMLRDALLPPGFKFKRTKDVNGNPLEKPYIAQRPSMN